MLTVETKLGLGAKPHTFGFDRLVTSEAQTVAYLIVPLERIVDPSCFLSVPVGQTVEQIDS